jgi:hypothetical protein
MLGTEFSIRPNVEVYATQASTVSTVRANRPKLPASSGEVAAD